MVTPLPAIEAVSSSLPSPASSAIRTPPPGSTLALEARGPAAMLQVGFTPTGHPSESRTIARKPNRSPGRRILREGETSRRAGSPAVPVQLFGAGRGLGAETGVAVGARGAL